MQGGSLANVAYRVAPRLGRYEILGSLGRGGMANVYLARTWGDAGFSRLFAVKVLHPHLAEDAAFVSMLLDEARIAARLHHPNVVPIVDLGSQDGSHYVVMDYVEGCPLSALLNKHHDERPPRVLVSIMLDALCGLHAAHTLTDDDGAPMNLVHRDVSPQNILVGVDGTAHITDFGVARAESRIGGTRPGQFKGKVAYMAPEQIRGAHVDSRTDVFVAGAMLWSALTGCKLFSGESNAETMTNVLQKEIAPPSTVGLHPPAAFDAVVLRALERNPDDRFASAQEMEDALREAAVAAGALGTRREVGDWVKATFADELSARRTAIRAAATPARASIPESSPSTSGLRSTPDFGSMFPPALEDGSGSSSSRRSSSERTARATWRLPAIVAGVVAVAALAVAFGAWRALREPQPAPSAPASLASAPATAAGPPAFPATTAVAPATASAPVSAASPAVAATLAVSTVTPPAIRTQPYLRKPAASAGDTTRPPTPTVWDKDSPLPP
jgi:serine/threonine-protein kinase